MKNCPVCNADIQTGFRDEDGVWHKAKIWGNPLKSVVQVILDEAQNKDQFNIQEADTWSADANITITLSVSEICQLAKFAGFKFKCPIPRIKPFTRAAASLEGRDL